MESLYPTGPVSVPDRLTAPSKTYRRHAWFAMVGLIAFIAVYLGLLCWFAWTAFRLFSGLLASSSGDGDAFLTFATGLCAIFLAFFMAKALVFNKRAQVSSNDIELKAEQQPELFAFLYRLADEARAPRPHRVYLSARVNAGVFYDLSLANLILPSRKNLEIGLALVNVLNLGELKAVLAHEFGHFAQRTMAVGRWVYVTQQIASHIVAKRDAMDTFLATLSRLDFRIAWVGWTLSLIIWSIRSLIEIAFRGVVLAQRALSREMEYQADLVAASLTGSDALVHALHRLAAADEAWHRAMQFAHRELEQGRAVKDLFAIQSRVIEHMRTVLAAPNYGQSPELPAERSGEHRVFRAELAQPPQMWATHPPSFARETNIKRTYIACAIDDRPALGLLRDVQALREEVSRDVFSGELPEFSPIETSVRRLDEQYALLSLSRRYRGAFLGRSFVREYTDAADLYVRPAGHADLTAQLEGLYSEAYGDDIERLRELEQQRATLEAVRAGTLQAVGGMLHWRGSQISRKSLPSAIDELERELEPLRRAVTEHDQRCRSLHLAAAEKLGPGWVELLRGQLRVLHYAEHAEADVHDAHALLDNTYQVVTADRRVSASELRRLVAACNQVQAALEAVHAQAPQLTLDARIAEKLGAQAWAEVLQKSFTLPRASESNINEWMKAADGWLRATLGPISALRNAALEALLATEDDVARQLRAGTNEPAPSPAASVPREYITLLPGRGRRLQHKLGWWDQFQSAQGWLPATARVAVAGGIVGAVLMLGGAVGMSKVSVFNGLARTIEVEIDGQSLTVQPFGSGTLSVPNRNQHQVLARTADDSETVESFDADAPSGTPHMVYNIAGGAPLVEWTASYGSTANIPETRLGAVRWSVTKADHVFAEPPQSIQSRDGNGSRLVLSGLADAAPSQLLGTLKSDVDPDAAAMIAAHARWDAANTRYVGEWMWRAHDQGNLAGIIAARLKRHPEEVVTLRLEQELAKGSGQEAVCARHRTLAARTPESPALHYIATRCIADETARDNAFVAAHQRWPEEPWLAMAAGYVYSERAQLEQALPLLEQGSLIPEAAEGVVPELARLKRGMSGAPLSELASLADRSSYLSNMLALESGKETDGTPFAAYRFLASGDLSQAMSTAAADEATSNRILRLAAASDGASPELVSRMLALPAQAGIDGVTAWTSLALATRERRDAPELRQAALALDPDEAQAIARFFDAVRTGADIATAEAALGKVSLRSRGIAYSTAVVLKGDQCPTSWRDAAKRLLFTAERPYFS